MTFDVSDLDLDEGLVEVALALHQQLHDRGDALIVRQPPTSSATTSPGGRSWREAAFAAAAAVIITLIIGGVTVARRAPAPSTVATEGSPTTTAPSAPASPWRLTLDPASGFQLAMADRSLPRPSVPITTTTEPGTVIARSTTTLWAAPDGATRPPLLVITVSDHAGPSGPYRGPFDGEIAATIGDHPGTRLSAPGGVERVRFNVDADHLVVATSWGIEFDDLSATFRDARLGANLRLVLANPPTDLVAHDLVVPEPWESDDRYDSVYVPQGGTQADAQVGVYVSHEDRHVEVLTRLVADTISIMQLTDPTVQGPPGGTVEAVMVNGRPALLTFSPFGPSVSIIWHEPESGTTVALHTTNLDRTRALGLVDHLRPIDDVAWQRLTGRCPNPMVVGEPASAC